MDETIELLQKKLNSEDASFLQEIYEPTVVAVPPSDAFSSLCITPEGEIRCYGVRKKGNSPDEPGEAVYISSVDCGLSWKLHRVPKGSAGPSVKSPYSGCYLSPYLEDGILYMRISDTGCDSTSYETVVVGKGQWPYRLPIPLRMRKRWVFLTETSHSVIHLSDDDGKTWRVKHIEEADHFVQAEPHQGPRWENSGVEPALVELTDGTLMMYLRTSTDYHYVTYSHDGGESWSKPVPTYFHSTLTNPAFLRLQDGRILFFYNNTRPLPEQDKKKVWPYLSDDEINGVWEDVFTNRDTNCVAVTDNDANSWTGFRELYLNELRNTCDFRSSGSNSSGRDKSVHQFQAIELPYHKVMVHVGQHSLVRKIIIFDLDWLYEKERTENFQYGMRALSTQVYLKSVSGGFRGFTGHCAWNRTNGAVLVPDPSGDHTEALLLRNSQDDLLFNCVQGVVWNFPAAVQGTVNIKLLIQGEGIRVSLLDHWINPSDITVSRYAQFTGIITGETTKGRNWTELEVQYDTRRKIAVLYADRTPLSTLNMQGVAPNGLCYLHLQTATEKGDTRGTLIKNFSFHELNSGE